ncbi:hypothetical protein KTR9_0430 [Gordonia sp. KTR9]|nr:hypothetical protein KTR9_0430 [Gordonia sp. KTR9]
MVDLVADLRPGLPAGPAWSRNPRDPNRDAVRPSSCNTASTCNTVSRGSIDSQERPCHASCSGLTTTPLPLRGTIAAPRSDVSAHT